MDIYTSIFRNVHNIVTEFTGRLTGMNVVTQSWGNNAIPPVIVKLGEDIVFDIKTPSMPARTDVTDSLESGRFITNKSSAPSYNNLLEGDTLPSSEVLYLIAYMTVSLLRGDITSKIGVVRIKMLSYILTTLPKTVKFSITVFLDGIKEGEKIPRDITRHDVEQFIQSLATIGKTYDEIPVRGKAGKGKIKVGKSTKLVDLSTL